jgi:maleylpyruvate isomerase
MGAELPRLYAIPFSTNVERVRLAAHAKGIPLDDVLVDPSDRSSVVDVSGQELVPVLVADSEVVADSRAILLYLEERWPEPPLYPADPARREELLTFADWFDLVWKVAPNRLAALVDDGAGQSDEAIRLASSMHDSLDRFEALLTGRDFLFGSFGAADCLAFPFLRYAIHGCDPDDAETFHHVLADALRIDGGHPLLEAWIRRVAERGPERL